MRRLMVIGVAGVVVAAVGVGLAAAGSRARSGWIVRELPGSGDMTANAINNKGWLAGSADIDGGCYAAALWAKGRVRELGTLGGQCSVANDVNDRGQVVGWSLTDGDDFDSRRAFLWEKGKMRDLGVVCGEAMAINERGQIVGVVDPDCGGDIGAWMWQNGKARRLLPSAISRGHRFGAAWSGATGVNERGQVVGWSNDGVFLYRNGKVRMLGIESDDHPGPSINDPGQVVTPGIDPRLWQNGKTTSICRRSDGCTLYAINSHGQVVGCRDSGFAFAWQDGKRTPLPIPRGQTACAIDINDQGEAIGYSSEGPVDVGHSWAWLWQPTR